MVKAHNCKGENNQQLISTVWDVSFKHLVSTWRCRRCGATWTTTVAKEEIKL